MKPKLPVVRIPSDDCMVYVGRKVEEGKVTREGTPYAVHKGEWVEVMPVVSMEQYLALSALASLTAVEHEKIGLAFESLCKELASRIITWNWTDMMGEPLPSPYGRPEVLRALSNDEWMWLVLAVQGETPAQRGNGSAASANTSSEAAISRRKRS